MYIDESGDTATQQEGGSKFLVLSGCIIEEKDKLPIEKTLRDIKTKYYFNPDIEIKSNFLRYANPDILNMESPIKLHDRKQYDALETDITNFLKQISVTVISVVIYKSRYWSKYPAQNPYDAAYIFLLERFQTFLQFKKAFGLCIIDPREGQVEKHFIGIDLDKTHHKLRWSKTENFWKNCPNVIERILFSTSDLTIGIQLADLYCYPVFNVFEYNKTKYEYWRFHDITFPKLYSRTTTTTRSANKTESHIDGTGLKFFPTESKKDFRFYQQ